MRAILQTPKVLVLSGQFALGRAHESFNQNGGLRDATQRAAIAALAKSLAEVSAELSA